jgi:hypothetical protein
LIPVSRISVDRPAVALRRRLVVDGVAEHVPDPPERLLPDRHRDRPARVDDVDAARKPVRRVHGDGADSVVPEVLLDLGDELAAVHLDLERGVDLREPVREDGVDHDALDLDHLADASAVRLLSHVAPEEGWSSWVGGVQRDRGATAAAV